MLNGTALTVWYLPMAMQGLQQQLLTLCSEALMVLALQDSLISTLLWTGKCLSTSLPLPYLVIL